MEFNVKLQELRKQKGLTQEELAELLFVSRAAVSKWESGRGYPSIDSLKAIAKIFTVSLDSLLSCNEIINIAEDEKKENEKLFRNLIFGLLDTGIILLLFLPLFAEIGNNSVSSVSLLALNNISTYLKISYFAFVTVISVFGVLSLALQNYRSIKNKSMISLILSIIGTFLFIISCQPYAAVVTLVFLMIKVFVLIRKR